MRASRPVTRSGGSVLKASVSIVVGAPQRGHTPSSGAGYAKRGLRPQGAPAPQRGHSPASMSAKPFLSKPLHSRRGRVANHPRRRCSCGAGAPSPVSPHPRSRHPIAAKVLMRSGGSVLEAPPGAEEGALPREHRPRAGRAELTRASSASRLCRTYASILCVPDSRPAARASASTLEPLDMNF